MTLSTKARYAAFLLLKNSFTGPNFLKRFRRISTKARYAAFLLSKNLIIGPGVFRAGPALSDRACSRFVVQKNIGKVAALDHAVSAFNPTDRIKAKTIVRVQP